MGEPTTLPPATVPCSATARLKDTRRGLTIRWPWLSAIVSGHRPIELRRRPPPQRLMGRWIWLHCATANGPRERADAAILEAADVDISAARGHLGHIVGRARLARAEKLLRRDGGYIFEGPIPTRLRWRWVDELLPPWCATHELWMWSIVDVDPIEPIGPVRGQLGFWGLPDDAARLATKARTSAVRRAVYATLDGLAWDLGPMRQSGPSWAVGRPGGLQVRVNQPAGVVEATLGNLFERRDELVTAAHFTRAIEDTVARLGGVRNSGCTSAPPDGSIGQAAAQASGQR